ncbi:MAG: hypothetical protein R2867_26125 [Caldilineaceae bacterium]
MEHNELLIIAAVLAAGTFCQWLAWRIKIPAILPLLAAGFLAGPVLGLLHPQDALKRAVLSRYLPGGGRDPL